MLRTISICVVVLTAAACSGVRCVAEVKPRLLVGTPEVRTRCHAHFQFLAATYTDDTDRRVLLLNEAVKLDPRLARAYYNRGVYFVKSGALPKARDDFQTAVKLDEGYIYAHFNLACVEGMAGRPAEAIAALEKALAHGYVKFDAVRTDADLANVRKDPAFVPLVAKYEVRSKTAHWPAPQRFQIGSENERAVLLSTALEHPDDHAAELARRAMYDPVYQIRVLSMHLWKKLDRPESQEMLLRGLYDVDGYVKKAAAGCLIEYGKEIAPLLVWTLDDRDYEAPFYAVQMLGAVGATDSVDKIVPFLRDPDSFVRQVAAVSLAKLGAVATLPQIEAALAALPVNKETEFERIELLRAIEQLKKLQQANRK